MIRIFHENKCKTLVRLSLERLRPVVIETRVQVRCTASRPSQTQDGRLVKSEWNIKGRETENQVKYKVRIGTFIICSSFLSLTGSLHFSGSAIFTLDWSNSGREPEEARGKAKRTQLRSECENGGSSCGTVTGVTHLPFRSDSAD